MGKVKYFFKIVTLLNTLLLGAIIFMVTYTLLPFLNMNIQYTLPAQKKAVGGEEANQAEFSPPSPSDYTLISEENLFHPERRIPPEKKVEPELPKPDFVLYGTMVSDDLNVAYLEDLKAPRTTPGRGKRQTAVKKGDVFGGFTLIQVAADSIVMVRGEETLMVHVIDKRKTKMRESALTEDKKGQAKPAQSNKQSVGSAAKEPLPSPKQPSAIPPPKTPFESAVRDFFDKQH